MAKENIDRRDSQQVYNEQAQDFAAKAPTLLTWEYIGKKAFAEPLKALESNPAERAHLDVGSASGRVPRYLIDQLGYDPTKIDGVEISDEEVKIARQNIPEANFDVGDIRTFALPSEKYDTVTCNMVLEFLDAEGLKQALENIFASMKPGATFVYISTHPGRVEGKYGLGRDHEGWFKTGGPWGGEFENWHRSIGKYITQTEESGFLVRQMEAIDMPQQVLDSHPEFQTFGAPARFVVIAEKPSSNS